MSMNFNESSVQEDDMKVSIMSKLKEIEKNTKNAEIEFDNLTPSLNKMDNLFQELTRKASKRISSSNISQLSPTLFSAKHNKMKRENTEFNIDLKNSDMLLGEYELMADLRAQAMEIELRGLEKEEADLEAYLNQLKGGVVSVRRDQKKPKSAAKFENRRLEMLIKKRNSALKDEFRHKITFNDNYFVHNTEITQNELIKMIHFNQEKIINETNAIKRLKDDIQKVHDDNLLLETLSLNKEKIVEGKIVPIDKETNTVYYNKNIIYKKEIDRLARENNKLQEYYSNLALKLKSIK